MIPLTYILINLIQAVWHSYLIKKNRLIQSGQKIIEYSVASILAGVILYSFSGGKLLPLILFCILTRLAFFSAFLNIFRFGVSGINYESISSNKKRWTFDWIQYKIGWPIWVFRVVYLAAFLIYLIIWMRQ